MIENCRVRIVVAFVGILWRGAVPFSRSECRAEGDSPGAVKSSTVSSQSPILVPPWLHLRVFSFTEHERPIFARRKIRRQRGVEPERHVVDVQAARLGLKYR